MKKSMCEHCNGKGDRECQQIQRKHGFDIRDDECCVCYGRRKSRIPLAYVSHVPVSQMAEEPDSKPG